MPLSISLPTSKVAGDPAHAAGHNATNTAVNTIADTYDTQVPTPPSHAGTRTGIYDPVRSVYNLTAGTSRKLRAKLAAVRAGADECRIGFIGDSLTLGVTAAYGVEDEVSRLRDALVADGLQVGEQVYAVNASGAPDPRWTYTSGWSTSFFWLLYVNGTGETATFTSTNTGTVVEFPVYGQTAAFSYTIDGGSPVTVTPSGSAVITYVTVTGLPDTTHTVVFSTLSTGDTNIISCGVRYPAGVTLINAGLSGSTAAGWYGDWYFPLPTLLANSPDVVIIELGCNDVPGITATAAAANLQAIIDTCVTAGVEVYLAATHNQIDEPYTATWHPMLVKLYDLADTNDVPLLDFAAAFGTFTQADALGLLNVDNEHCSPAGYALRGALLANLCVPVRTLPVAVTGVAASGITRDGDGLLAGFSQGGVTYSAITRDGDGLLASFKTNGTLHTVTRSSGRITGVS